MCFYGYWSPMRPLGGPWSLPTSCDTLESTCLWRIYMLNCTWTALAGNMYRLRLESRVTVPFVNLFHVPLTNGFMFQQSISVSKQLHAHSSPHIFVVGRRSNPEGGCSKEYPLGLCRQSKICFIYSVTVYSSSVVMATSGLWTPHDYKTPKI